MIKIQGVSHYFSKELILKDINLSIDDGTILGLVGINGAGKSTLLRLLCGVYSPDKGSIEIDGLSPSLEQVRQDIFFLPDDPYYSHQDTIKSIFNMYSSLYHVNIDTYNRLVDVFGINEAKPLRTFSKGMRRQAYIIIALSIEPKYLLLDEAFDGLDPLCKRTVKNELIRLVDELGSTVIISSHSLKEIEDFCDMYAIIDKKSINSSGNLAEKVGSYCKFMLGFSDNIPENPFNGLPVIYSSGSGKFISAVFKGDANDIQARLISSLNPAVIENLPVDFEEVFINEISRRYGNDEL